MKILLAVDGSPCSEEAIEETGRRPWPTDSVIKVVSAFELPLPPSPDAWAVPPSYLDDMDRLARKHAEEIVEQTVEKLNSKLGNSVTVMGKTLPGSPRIAILDEAEEWDANLIVVGSHGYRAWERFLLGSVSQSVVSHAKCSVEIVRCPDSNRPRTEPPTLREMGQ